MTIPPEQTVEEAVARSSSQSGSVTRRTAFKAGAALAVACRTRAAAAQPAVPPAMPPAGAVEAPPLDPGARTVPVQIKVNGRTHRLQLDARTSLLDMLREHLQLTGSKKGCDHGQCGACTVLLEGRRINACLTLAVMHDGESVTTIEGLGEPDHLHPMQAAFVKHDGFQCGYCTPGQICSAVGMLAEARAGMPSAVTEDLGASARPLSDGEFRERMSGNLCRCSAYPNIIASIREVADAGGGA